MRQIDCMQVLWHRSLGGVKQIRFAEASDRCKIGSCLELFWSEFIGARVFVAAFISLSWLECRSLKPDGNSDPWIFFCNNFWTPSARPSHLPPKCEEESEHHRNLVRLQILRMTICVCWFFGGKQVLCSFVKGQGVGAKRMGSQLLNQKGLSMKKMVFSSRTIS